MSKNQICPGRDKNENTELEKLKNTALTNSEPSSSKLWTTRVLFPPKTIQLELVLEAAAELPLLPAAIVSRP